ncbi:MAG: hypothetical protein WKF30_04905 [Pyrinomonadaceae bacterium]
MSLAPWHFQIQQLLLPKPGSGAGECEDVIALNETGGRFAVADGATEAFDARNWALALANNWAQGEESALTVEDFRRWVTTEGERLHAAWHNRQLPWYAEEKLRRGSFAAFVGLQVELTGDGALRWRSIALGDSCFFLVREGKLCVAFPLSDPQSFHSHPLLVPSLVVQQQAALAQTVVAEGRSSPATCGLLSDAVAAWYLQKHRAGDAILREI